MKVDITIKFDKELVDAFTDSIREFSKELTGIFNKPDLSVSTESVAEPEPKQTKPAAKIKARAKNSLRDTVLELIKKKKDGISRKELQEQTGFSTKQISNYVYQLKKNQKIEKTEDGLFKPL